MIRTRTTRRAALSLAFLTVFSISPAFADGGGSQGSSGGKPPNGSGGKAAPTAPASPVAAIVVKIRALFGL